MALSISNIVNIVNHNDFVQIMLCYMGGAKGGNLGAMVSLKFQVLCKVVCNIRRTLAPIKIVVYENN